MTWTKLDDAFWSNPKVHAIGNAAAGAYCRMLSYCGNQLSDGHVPDHIVKVVATRGQLAKLEEQGMVKRNGTGWLIPDYLDFNPTRKKALADRKRARERMAELRANAA